MKKVMLVAATAALVCGTVACSDKLTNCKCTFVESLDGQVISTYERFYPNLEFGCDRIRVVPSDSLMEDTVDYSRYYSCEEV